MSRRDKERTKKFNFLEFCQDIYLDIVVTYLLAYIAWEKCIKPCPRTYLGAGRRRKSPLDGATDFLATI